MMNRFIPINQLQYVQTEIGLDLIYSENSEIDLEIIFQNVHMTIIGIDYTINGTVDLFLGYGLLKKR